MSLTPEQLEWRRGGIGGSEAAAVLGEHPYCSALELYMRKRGTAPEQEESTRLRCGSFLEAFVVSEYERETGREVDTSPERCHMITHPEHDFMRANVDGWAGDRLVEAKTVSSWAFKFMWVNGESPPLYIQIQCQHYMAITGAEVCDLVALADYGKLRIWEQKRNDSFISDRLVPALCDFWAMVQAGVPPVPDESKSASDALRMMYDPKDALEDLVPAPHAAGLVDTYTEQGEIERMAKHERAGVRNKILGIIGEHQGIDLGDGRIVVRDKRNALRVKEIG